MRLVDLQLTAGDRSTVQRLVKTGRWQRLGTGLYLTREGELGDRVLAAAATLLTAGPGHQPAVTGLVAARALGLPWVPASSRAQVLVPPHVRRTSTPSVLVRRADDHAELTTWNWGPARLVDAERAVLDGVRECSGLREARGLVLGAVAQGWASPDALDHQLDRGGRRADALCRRVVLDARRGAASPPEAEAADGLVGRGWPFALNVELWVDDVLLGITDLLLLRTGVCGEVDSVERHSGRSLSATLARHGRFDRAGLAVEHVTPHDLRPDPRVFAERLVARAEDRLARGLGEPAGPRARCCAAPCCGDQRMLRTASVVPREC